jgi:hypothetical protein
MRRVLLAGLLGATAILPLPARAETDDVCVGWGTMQTWAPITYLPFGPPAHTSWIFSLQVGACALGSSFTAAGEYWGWCELGTGTGVTTLGNRFAFVSVGKKIIYTGEVSGESPFVENPFTSDCFTGATQFLVGFGGGLNWGCKVVEQGGTEPGPFGLPVHHMTCL